MRELPRELLYCPSRKLKTASRVKFSVATAGQISVMFVGLGWDVSEAGDKTEAMGISLEFTSAQFCILRNNRAHQLQMAIKAASLPFLIISQFEKNIVGSSVAENRPSMPLIVIALLRRVCHMRRL